MAHAVPDAAVVIENGNAVGGEPHVALQAGGAETEAQPEGLQDARVAQLVIILDRPLEPRRREYCAHGLVLRTALM